MPLPYLTHENIKNLPHLMGLIQQEQQHMWEYLVVYISDSKVAEDQKEIDVHLDADKFTEKLNKFGSAGWELISFEWETDGAKAAFKRPRK